jgi:TRAP-type uncharacterized transport system fused permease subunit
MDDPNAPVTSCRCPARRCVRAAFPAAGVVLVWALMVDRLSPGPLGLLGAAFMIFILVTQRPLMAFFRGEGDRPARRRRALRT